MKYLLEHPVKGIIGSEKFLTAVHCTLATVRMYIDLKGLNIPEIIVEANMFQKIRNEGVVMHIERNIIIPEVTDTELQQRLIHIAENCPVSKILKGNISIASELTIAGTETSPTKTDQNIN
jgi:putative redox protein